MTRINKITTALPIPAERMSALAQNMGSVSESHTSLPETPSGDQFALSDDWPRQSEIEKAMIDGLKILQKDFPKVQILIGTGLKEDMLNQMAAELGEGRHLVISSDWLEQISSSPEAFEYGKQFLRSILSCLSGSKNPSVAQGAYIDTSGVRFWSVKSAVPEENTIDALKKQYEPILEQLKELQKNNKKNNSKNNSSSKNKFKIKTSNPNYSVTRSYARLASAGSKAQVQSAMSDARRSIASLRMAASNGETMKERNKARAAISSLQKLLLRGSRKIRRLNEEDLVKLRKKRAEKKKQEEQLRHELQKKQTARRLADRAILVEGHLDDVNNAFRFRKLRDDEWEEGSIYSPNMPSSAAPSLEMSPESMAIVGAGNIGTESISATDVVMSEVVAF